MPFSAQLGDGVLNPFVADHLGSNSNTAILSGLKRALLHFPRVSLQGLVFC
jgi:hypothetical protein